MINTSIIHPENFKRLLLSKEDYLNVHRLLGLTCFLNFILRIIPHMLFLTPNGMFSTFNGKLFTVIIHTLLHISSFQFHIPLQRSTWAPMIWPEYRIHSMIFAFRSIIFIILFDKHFFGFNNIFVHYALVMGTMIAADATTEYYKKFKVNSKTMRRMPYGKNVPQWIKDNMHYFYSCSQLAITGIVLSSNNIDIPFVTLFCVQFAAFLMTAVRKSILTHNGWHLIYAITLAMNWYVWAQDRPSLIGFGGFALIAFCRIKLRLNKYLLWTLAAIGTIALKGFYVQ